MPFKMEETDTIAVVKKIILAEFGVPLQCQKIYNEDGETVLQDGTKAAGLTVELKVHGCVQVNVFNIKNVFIEIQPGAKVS